jgi:hypothetical protein
MVDVEDVEDVEDAVGAVLTDTRLKTKLRIAKASHALEFTTYIDDGGRDACMLNINLMTSLQL